MYGFIVECIISADTTIQYGKQDEDDMVVIVTNVLIVPKLLINLR